MRDDVEHVTQLCVAARARGAGLGTLLLDVAARSLAARGMQTLSLTVTGGNDRAAALYRRMGFGDQHAFDAMVWTSLHAVEPPRKVRAPQPAAVRTKIMGGNSAFSG